MQPSRTCCSRLYCVCPLIRKGLIVGSIGSIIFTSIFIILFYLKTNNDYCEDNGFFSNKILCSSFFVTLFVMMGSYCLLTSAALVPFTLPCFVSVPCAIILSTEIVGIVHEKMEGPEQFLFDIIIPAIKYVSWATICYKLCESVIHEYRFYQKVEQFFDDKSKKTEVGSPPSSWKNVEIMEQFNKFLESKPSE